MFENVLLILAYTGVGLGILVAGFYVLDLLTPGKLGQLVMDGNPGAALVASGLPSDVWRFAGFLPRKKGALEDVLRSPETVVAFESPRRVGASLAVLAAMDGERPVAVCRELTKLHEEIVRGTAAELAERYSGEDPRGEIVLVIGGAPARAGLDPGAVDAVRRLVEAGARAKTAAAVVSELTGAPANALYRELLG